MLSTVISILKELLHGQNDILYVCACMLSRFSHVQLFVTLLAVACQAPLSMGFSRQEYWSGLPFPPPGDLSDPGIEPESPALQVGDSDLLLSHLRSPIC